MVCCRPVQQLNSPCNDDEQCISENDIHLIEKDDSFSSNHLSDLWKVQDDLPDIPSNGTESQHHIDFGTIGSSETDDLNMEAGDDSPSMEDTQGSPLAMWETDIQTIKLEKGILGLGFSILDYQDPIDPASTVIVIRSLVPEGVAEQDGRLLPGDRLMFVNEINLEHASLEEAVQALKGAPAGNVSIGVAKPLPLSPEEGYISAKDDSLFYSANSYVEEGPNDAPLFHAELAMVETTDADLTGECSMESRFAHNNANLLQASLIALHGSPCNEDLLGGLSDCSLQALSKEDSFHPSYDVCTERLSFNKPTLPNVLWATSTPVIDFKLPTMDFYNLNLDQPEHTKLSDHTDVASSDSKDHSELVIFSKQIENTSTSLWMPLQTHGADTAADIPPSVSKAEGHLSGKQYYETIEEYAPRTLPKSKFEKTITIIRGNCSL
ncbi:hypothetical protein AB205_0019010, partial [Aquarana catesbeiana]